MHNGPMKIWKSEMIVRRWACSFAKVTGSRSAVVSPFSGSMPKRHLHNKYFEANFRQDLPLLWSLNHMSPSRLVPKTACCSTKHEISTSSAHFAKSTAQHSTAVNNVDDSHEKGSTLSSESSHAPNQSERTEQRDWTLGRLNHVAIACSDLEATSTLFRDILGAKVTEPQDLPAHGVTVVFIELGNTKLELLKPLSDKSPVSAFLQRNPAGGIHHICIEVDDVEAASDYLNRRNIKVLGKPSIGAHNKPVIFIHPKSMSGVLTEFEQA